MGFPCHGEVSEWLKEHAWKACVGETQPWVRIPPSPPLLCFQWVRFLPKTFPKNSSELSQLSIEKKRDSHGWQILDIQVLQDRRRLALLQSCILPEWKNQTKRRAGKGKG